MINRVFILAVFTSFLHIQMQGQQKLRIPVLVVGGGTSGTAAGIQSARMGVSTIIVEEGPWLGGMISAAGVSAIDGNHRLPSGLWKEFRDQIYAVYGGPKAVETGWVSNTLFEPHIADSIFKAMTRKEKNLQVLHGWQFQKTFKKGQSITGARFENKLGQTLDIIATVTIDATELGDVLASAQVPYSLGMEDGKIADEQVGIDASNDIVQDLTWVATLQDYGKGADCTITKPAGYTPAEFDGACTDYYVNKSLRAPSVNAQKMLDYGKLPKGKYMLNWPNAGNDTYLNIIEMSPKDRTKALEAAKETTLRFLYFIQTELGFSHIGLAKDEFPTADRLAIMPYHRESRRVKGIVRLNIKQMAEPYAYGQPLYRTGISVGDYPIDHHHKKNEKAPQHLEFYSIPSYSIPLGALIPEKADGLIVAEKSISVSNVVNGTTRLQPVVLLTGQAAGTLAALTAKEKTKPRSVSVRAVQSALLNSRAYIMPFIDVSASDPHFISIQKIGATGILKGTGTPYKWANQTWFYPDSVLMLSALPLNIQANWPSTQKSDHPITIEEAISYVEAQTKKKMQAEKWTEIGLSNYRIDRPISRAEWAVWLDKTLDPFNKKPIDHQGNWK